MLQSLYGFSCRLPCQLPCRTDTFKVQTREEWTHSVRIALRNSWMIMLTATGPEVRGTEAGTEVAHDQRRNNGTRNNKEQVVGSCKQCYNRSTFSAVDCRVNCHAERTGSKCRREKSGTHSVRIALRNSLMSMLTATGPEVRGTDAGTEVAHDQRRNNRTLSNEEHSLRVCILVEKPLQRVNPTSKCARQLF